MVMQQPAKLSSFFDARVRIPVSPQKKIADDPIGV
ncbi:protein of unknown function [Tenacibaculum sp. 190524A02b]